MYKYDIKTRREELNVTLQDIADVVKVGKSTVRKWETGDIENMKRDKIMLLAKALKITPSEFMGWTNSEESSIVSKHTENNAVNSTSLDLEHGKGTAATIEEVCKNPELLVLFETIIDLSPEDITKAVNIIKALKG